ncbi:MAG: VOC family protein [Gemmatimonadota bacterium]
MSEPLKASAIFPGITASDLPKSIRFYVDGLGFEITQKVEDEGVVRFVMLKAGSVELGIGMDDFAKGRDRVKGVAVRLYIQTSQDLHALAARLAAAGFSIDGEVGPLSWGPVGFAVTDPDGIALTIANEG